ncbi:MAG: helix-turn-helix transcriptional regulator [Rhodospirillaceae bacterium]
MSRSFDHTGIGRKPENELITRKQVMQILGVSSTTFHRYFRAGFLPDPVYLHGFPRTPPYRRWRRNDILAIKAEAC